MRVATYNVNSINARLPNLLRWLQQTTPDVVCLQELKAPQEKFPEGAIRNAGYGVIWHGQKSYNGVAILARNDEPAEIRRALPGDPDDVHSRYIEATVKGVLIGCLYLPNGNPAPGPKFDYKLRWLQRLTDHAAELAARETPVVLAGDYNVIPTEKDVYKPERWVHAKINTYWDFFRNAYERDAGLRIDHLLLNANAVKHLERAGVDRDVRGWEKASDHAPAWIELDGSTKASWTPMT
jgi:exodeoxyribonuclease-3